MTDDERRRIDRSRRFSFHAHRFAENVARATPEERRESIDQALNLFKILDIAGAPMSAEDQADFDAEMGKPLKERHSNFHYPDDPRTLISRAASLMREAADLSEEAQQLLHEAAIKAGDAAFP